MFRTDRPAQAPGSFDLVEEVDASCQRLRASGVAVERDPQDYPVGRGPRVCETPAETASGCCSAANQIFYRAGTSARWTSRAPGRSWLRA